mgnify:CR=1 FL=1
MPEDKKSDPGIQRKLAAERAVRRPGMLRITFSIQTDEVERRSKELIRTMPQRIHDGPLFRMHAAGLVGHLAIISCLVSRTAPLALPLSGWRIETSTDNASILRDDTAASLP